MGLSSIIFKVIDYVLVIAIAVAVFLLAGSFIRNQAIDGCAQGYRYSTTLSNGSTVAYPMATEYKQCLKDKGIK